MICLENTCSGYKMKKNPKPKHFLGDPKALVLFDPCTSQEILSETDTVKQFLVADVRVAWVCPPLEACPRHRKGSSVRPGDWPAHLFP